MSLQLILFFKHRGWQLLALACSLGASTLVIAEDDDFSIHVGGDAKFRRETFDGVYSTNGEEETYNALRRADIKIYGDALKRLSYEIKIKFDNDGEEELRKAYLDYHFKKKTYARVGRFDPDFSLEMTESSNAITANERSAIWDLAPEFGEGTEGKGLALHRYAKHYFGAIGYFNMPDYDLMSLRAVYAPLRDDDTVLHLGFSYSETAGATSDGRIKSNLAVWSSDELDNGNSTQLAKAISDNAFGDSAAMVFELALANGPFSLQSEHLERRIRADEAEEDREAIGTYLQFAYTLTGEARHYSMNNAKFGGIDPANKHLGAWEIFYRNDWLKTQGEAGLLKKNRTQGDAEVKVLGINWYANEYLKLSANAIEGNAFDIPNDDEDESGRALSFQVQTMY